jgi:dihydroorotate dehydrogenase electron transfer subunit
MAEKKRCQAAVLEQTMLARGIYSMWLQFPEEYNVAAQAVPGQFISMYCDEGSRLLPRPISICEIDPSDRKIRVVYRIAGEGTREFSQKKSGDLIPVLGPLGNGFPQNPGRAILIGGGIGIPPMLQLAKSLKEQGCRIQVVLGYRDGELFLKNEFDSLGDVYVSTEDGSVGTKGNVIDAVRANRLTADTIYACGPTPMLRGVKAFGEKENIPAWISLEEKMACGIGACLACVCQTKDVDEHSHVHNKRICKDGPVFYAGEIDL